METREEKERRYQLIAPYYGKTQDIHETYDNEFKEKYKHLSFVETVFGQSFAVSTLLATKEAGSVTVEALLAIKEMIIDAKKSIRDTPGEVKILVARDIEISFLEDLISHKKNGRNSNLKNLFYKYFKIIRKSGAMFL